MEIRGHMITRKQAACELSHSQTICIQLKMFANHVYPWTWFPKILPFTHSLAFDRCNLDISSLEISDTSTIMEDRKRRNNICIIKVPAKENQNSKTRGI